MLADGLTKLKGSKEKASLAPELFDQLRLEIWAFSPASSGLRSDSKRVRVAASASVIATLILDAPHGPKLTVDGLASTYSV